MARHHRWLLLGFGARLPARSRRSQHEACGRSGVGPSAPAGSLRYAGWTEWTGGVTDGVDRRCGRMDGLA
eukprot:354158-Chlamydomonas_euryale.AAC.1